ncbi:neural proliferation differentiation and control protein 1-like [Petromyzon marinus]|uniref:neural proliferation differentiation and control protein 1-like n=1 Tax=Petromyzon marinus TaxID=7757 RepID=UPI003F6EBC7A
MRRRRRGGEGGGGGVLVLVSFGALVIAAGLACASQLDLPGEEIDFISEQLKERSLQDAAPAPRSAPLGPDGRGSPNASAVTSAVTSAAPGPAGVDKWQNSHHDPGTDTLFLIILIACVVTGTAGLILAVVCCYYMQRSAKKAEKAGYPAFGATAGQAEPSKGLSGDRKLAQSAQMYHYQHQKQQIMAMERSKEAAPPLGSDSEDDGEEEGDFTVYECPGLAPTGEMEVRNPLFDDSTLPDNKKSHEQSNGTH